MNSFKAYLWKEYCEIIRSKRLIIFTVAFLFFAMVDPIMIKVLPEILKSQMGNVSPEALGFKYSQIEALGTYSKDMFQTLSLIVALTLMGITAGEKKNKTIVLPKIAGLKMGGFIGAKMLVNALVVCFITILGFLVCFIYSAIIFETGEKATLLNVFISSLLFSVHFIYLISLCIFYGSIVGKNIFAGILTITTNYTGALFVTLLPKIKEYFPYFLVEKGSSFTADINSLKSVAATAFIIIILCILSINKLKKTEL